MYALDSHDCSPALKLQALNITVLAMTTSQSGLSQRPEVSCAKEVYQENKTNQRQLEELQGYFKNL